MLQLTIKTREDDMKSLTQIRKEIESCKDENKLSALLAERDAIKAATSYKTEYDRAEMLDAMYN